MCISYNSIALYILAQSAAYWDARCGEQCINQLKTLRLGQRRITVRKDRSLFREIVSVCGVLLRAAPSVLTYNSLCACTSVQLVRA